MRLTSRVPLIAILTIGLTLVFLGGTALAQNPHAAPVASKPSAPPTAGAQMMAGMEADQKKLDAMVAEMNGAMGCEKMGKMAAAITELAARQNRMMMRMMQGGTMIKAEPAPAPAPQQTPKVQPNGHSEHHQEF